MNFRITRYNAASLQEFVGSRTYRQMPAVPVSRHRANSWLNNPRMRQEDILMYTAHEGEEMVGYRCILPDQLGDVRFGWLSGNWVMPRKRRQGIATRLFREADKDWNGLLMYTDFAPESGAVYDRTGRFGLYAEKKGMRYYLRSSTENLLGSRGALFRTLRPALYISDKLINTWQDTRLRAALKKNKPELIRAEPAGSMDREAFGLLASRGKLGFTRRGPEEFRWIQSWPWILETRENDKRYHFSSTARPFKNIYLKLFAVDGALEAFIMLTRIGGKMTVPYASIGEQCTKHALQILDHYLASEAVSYFTSHNPEILSLMRDSRLPLLGRHVMVRKYVATWELLGKLPEPSGIFFQDGDGDAVFT